MNNIIEQTLEITAEVLEMDFDEVNLDSKIVADLGADSLDIVDLSFSLGKKFDIKMPKKTVIMHAEELLGGMSGLVHDGLLTGLGAELLRVSPNAYTEEEAYAGQSLINVFADTTVRHWVNLCQAIIESELAGDELIKQNVECMLNTQDAVA